MKNEKLDSIDVLYNYPYYSLFFDLYEVEELNPNLFILHTDQGKLQLNINNKKIESVKVFVRTQYIYLLTEIHEKTFLISERFLTDLKRKLSRCLWFNESALERQYKLVQNLKNLDNIV